MLLGVDRVSATIGATAGCSRGRVTRMRVCYGYFRRIVERYKIVEMAIKAATARSKRTVGQLCVPRISYVSQCVLCAAHFLRFCSYRRRSCPRKYTIQVTSWQNTEAKEAVLE